MTEAASESGLAERSVRRLIARGVVVSKATAGRRWILAQSLPGQDRVRAESVTESGPRVSESGPVLESDALNSPRHTLSEGTAGGKFVNEVFDDVIENRNIAVLLSAVEQQRDQALSENAFLRQQLERRDQAEAELRRLLLMSQQALTAAMERPMLAAVNPEPFVAQGKKVRWWRWWRR